VLFTIPTRNVAAAPAMAAWLQANVPNAVLIGPDGESAQWVADIAARASVPFQVLTKTREGDREVRVSLPDPVAAHGRTPVVVDDIVSSGYTMIQTLQHLTALGLEPATCLVTHAVFAEDAYDRLLAAGARQVVSTDTIPHRTCNAIAMAPLLAAACESILT
jgi:ribose-phosphate pyrophosphokinase